MAHFDPEKKQLDHFKRFCYAPVDCYERGIIVLWQDETEEETVRSILETRYDQWTHTEENPEVESYCCEEWMLMGLDEIGLEYAALYTGGEE